MSFFKQMPRKNTTLHSKSTFCHFVSEDMIQTGKNLPKVIETHEKDVIKQDSSFC